MFGMKNKDEKGAGVNDLPGAGQSRAPARPQAGESATLHQKKLFCRLDKRAFSIKPPLSGLMKNEDAVLMKEINAKNEKCRATLLH